MFKNLKLFVFVFISLMTVFITSCTPPSAPELPPVPQAPAYDWTGDYSEVTLDTVKVTGTVNYSTSEPTESTYSTFYFDGSKWYRRNGSSSDELVLESLSKYFSLFVTNTTEAVESDELCAIIGKYSTDEHTVGATVNIDNAVYQYGRVNENGTREGLCNEYYQCSYGYVGGTNEVGSLLDKFEYTLYANGTVEITKYYNENTNGEYVNTAIKQISGALPIYVYSPNSSN